MHKNGGVSIRRSANVYLFAIEAEYVGGVQMVVAWCGTERTAASQLRKWQNYAEHSDTLQHVRIVPATSVEVGA